MPRSDRTTIVVKKAGHSYKICKIWFGSDGSYYVTSPYHRSGRAMLVKATVGYEGGPIHEVPMSDIIDIAGLEAGDQLKLSHHPDGFCQFSGKGVYSGKHPDGSPNGVGVQARALPHVAAGPTFIVMVNAIEMFEPYEETDETPLIFNYDALVPIPGKYGFRLEGHYLNPGFRRFVTTASDGTLWISLIHPMSAILHLRALVAPLNCAIPAVIGFDFYPSPVDLGSEVPDFVLAGSPGNLRDDPRGQNVADQLSAVYPPPDALPIRRNVDYPQREVPDSLTENVE
jgi:hypothetical protein